MISDIPSREDVLCGKTLLIIGLGRVGRRLAQLARAFDMRVLATKRATHRGAEAADAVYPCERLLDVLPVADVVVIACPLTADTQHLIDTTALAAMKPSAHLVNIARGQIVDEEALVRALAEGQLAAAALDVTQVEPLPADSPLWGMTNVLITPHKAGEMHGTEDAVVEILLENLERLWRGENVLRNEIV